MYILYFNPFFKSFHFYNNLPLDTCFMKKKKKPTVWLTSTNILLHDRHLCFHWKNLVFLFKKQELCYRYTLLERERKLRAYHFNLQHHSCKTKSIYNCCCIIFSFLISKKPLQCILRKKNLLTHNLCSFLKRSILSVVFFMNQTQVCLFNY